MPPHTPRSPQPAPSVPLDQERAAASGPRRSAPGPRRPKARAADVTAVLVAHDGACWLPETLAALDAATRTPQRILAVDTGSTDGSATLLQQAVGHVLHLPASTGYGAAIAAALATAPRTRWVWLLHDDCAVEPDTLDALLAQAELSPSAAVLGPKARDWADPRLLVEVGVTIGPGGQRETGLERREYDQGQHDGVRDVLAVGTAGALVRRDVWDEVGGLDPALPVHGDDLDLGWRVNAAGHRVVVAPAARIRHARASTTGRRSTGALPGRAAAAARRHALFVLLAHRRLPFLLPALLWVLLAGGARCLGLLLTRRPVAAADEALALTGLLRHPVRLVRAQRARARLRTSSRRELRGLFSTRTARLRTRAGGLADWLAGGAPAGPAGVEGGAEGGAVSGEPADDELAPAAPGLLRRLLLRPGVGLLAVLSLVALVAQRALLPEHGGVLGGGALLPAPAGARDLWQAYLGAWHPSAVGSSAPAAPWLPVVAALATLLLGKAWLAVDLLVLASVPLAGAAAYLAAGRLTRRPGLRVWAAATWALLPVGTAAVAGGRLEVAAVQIGLPLLVPPTVRLLAEDPRGTGWRRVWALGLGLSVVTAFRPVLWPLLAAVLLGGALLSVRRPGGGRRLLAALVAAGTPAALLLPWSLVALRHPVLVLTGGATAAPGSSAAGPVARSGWQLALLSPGGPGSPAAWVCGGLLLAALAATLRRTRARLTTGAWAVAALALAGAVVLDRLHVVPLEGVRPVSPDPGAALQVAGAAVLTAALVAADGARTRLGSASFGWRQPAVAVVAAAAAAVPVLAGGLFAAHGVAPLRRDLSVPLPAFARADLAASPGLRALVLQPAAGTRAPVRYGLVSAVGPRLGSDRTPPAAGQTRALDAVVADLLTARGSDAAEALSTRAVRFVALPATGAARRLVPVLDAQPGLVRQTSGRVLLWQVVAPSARLSVLPAELAARALSGDRAPAADLLRNTRPAPLPAAAEQARTLLPGGPPGRLLVLADAADRGWRATLDGVPLPRRTAWGWAQAFVLPATGGRLELKHDQRGRRHAIEVQVALLALALVLAAPDPRRDHDSLEDAVPTGSPA